MVLYKWEVSPSSRLDQIECAFGVLRSFSTTHESVRGHQGREHHVAPAAIDRLPRAARAITISSSAAEQHVAAFSRLGLNG